MWPFSRSNGSPFETWPIFRLTKDKKIYGRSIAAFINNMQCHLSTIDVYSDGAIDCWGFLDRDLFIDKIYRKWAVTTPSVGQIISVFEFGSVKPLNGVWFHNTNDLVACVDGIINELNPENIGLINMNGSDTELRNGVRYSKMGMANKYSYYNNDGTDIIGKEMSVVANCESTPLLTKLFVFADGMARIGPNGKLFKLTELHKLYSDQTMTNEVDAGCEVVISGLGRIKVSDTFGGIDSTDRIAEALDVVNELNGKNGVISLCRSAYAEYISNPNDDSKKKLLESYLSVPMHHRCYCGDMDTKDCEIIKALDGLL